MDHLQDCGAKAKDCPQELHHVIYFLIRISVFKRPRVVRLFYKNLCNYFIEWVRDLKFWENIHHPLYVTWHMSCVMRHISPVSSHMSRVMCQLQKIYLYIYIIIIFFLSEKVVEQVGGGSVINEATPSSFVPIKFYPVDTPPNPSLYVEGTFKKYLDDLCAQYFSLSHWIGS